MGIEYTMISHALEEAYTENSILVLALPETQYTKHLTQATSHISTKAKKIFYITLNQPSHEIIGELDRNKIDAGKFHFLDANQNNVKPEGKTTPSVCKLTEASQSITDTIANNKFDYLLLDSISTLSDYKSDSIATQFLHQLTVKVMLSDFRGLYTCLQSDIDSPIVRRMNMFTGSILNPGVDS